MQKTLIILIFLSLSFAMKAQDSIMVSVHDNTFLETFFSEKKLKLLEKKDKQIFNNVLNHTNSIYFLILLNLIFVYVLLLQVSRNKITKHYKTLNSINMLKQFSIIETQRSTFHLVAYFVLVNLLALLMLSFLKEKLKLDFNLTTIINAVVSFYIFNLVVNKLIVYLLDLKDLAKLLYFNSTTFLLLMMPLLIVVSLLSIPLEINMLMNVVKISIFIFIILFVWQEFRNILILKVNQINVVSFYYFLYLCTFKILPIAVLFKIVLGEIIKY